MGNFTMTSRSEIELLSRQEAKAFYCGRNTALCRVLGTFLMYVDTVDLSVSPRLMLDGYWEPWTTAVLPSLVRQGARCVNVGANLGYFALLLGDLVGPKGHVFAFEPNPRAYDLLRANIEVNGLTHIEAVRRAASDRAESATLRVADQCIGGGYVGDEGEFTSDGAVLHRPELASYVVPCSALDGYLEAGEVVDLVLIDAEGSEEKIWRGMQRVLTDNPQMVTILEYEYRRYKDPMGFLKTLEEATCGRGLETITDKGEIAKADLESLARGQTSVADASDALLVVRR